MAGNLKENQAQYFSTGVPETSIDATPYAPGLVGTECILNVGSAAVPLLRKYMYVKAGGSVVGRSCVKWSTAALSDQTVIAETATGISGFFAGWSATDTTVTIGQYFWIARPMEGSIVYSAHNVATNATQSSTGDFYVVSGVSLGSTITSFTTHSTLGGSASIYFAKPIAVLASSINSTSATALTSSATTAPFLILGW